MTKFVNAMEFPGLIVSGIVGQKIAAMIWNRIAGSGPPDTAQERVQLPGLLAAAVVEGTAYKLTRMAFDRGVRLTVARSTGKWPGEPGAGE